MKNAKHTPGPWGYDGDSIVWAFEKKIPICEMVDDGGSDRTGPAYATQAAANANALLIAAAPDLLSALVGLLEACRCQNGCAPDDLTCASNVARIAIAKAQGDDNE